MRKPYYVTVGERGGITLPSRLREELGLEAGDLLGILVTEDRKILLEPGLFVAKAQPTPAPKDLTSSPQEEDEPSEAIDNEEENEGEGSPGREQKVIRVISIYNQQPEQEIKTEKGETRYTKNIAPKSWKKQVYYKFRAERERFCVEIISRRRMVPLVENILKGHKKTFEDMPGVKNVDWISPWGNFHGGRFYVAFDFDENDKIIADGMRKLIQVTFDEIDPLVKKAVSSS